jgi:hypothetical protein
MKHTARTEPTSVTRRKILAGATAFAAAPYVLCRPLLGEAKKKSFAFKTYRKGKTLCPITQVTPGDGFYIHTFFDRSPLSPSGRYLVCLKMPFQDRAPGPSDTAEICLVDMREQTIESVYTTSGWDAQTAAHQQWGRTGRYLYFNDKRDHHAVTVRFDVQTRKAEKFDGPLYQISPDESYALSADLTIIGDTQPGYGIIVDPKYRKVPVGASDKEGLWRTDLRTGKKSLLLSMAQVYEALPDKKDFEGRTFYGFHVKFNRDGSRIQLVIRTLKPNTPQKRMVVTFRPDASDFHVALPYTIWAPGGHHPDWHPDGENITMNIVRDRVMRFCEFRYDGADFQVLRKDLVGGGHPSIHRDGRWLVSDAYTNEPCVLPNGEVPIRWIDLRSSYESRLCSMWTLGKGGVGRCDPHPAWSFDYTRVSFNGAPEGKKQVFVADVSRLLS